MDLATLLFWCYAGLQGILTVAVIVLASHSIFVNYADLKSSLATDTRKTTLKLWLKTIYKMRSIYVGLLVHTFDFLTDLTVIYQWYTAESENNNRVEHVDSRLMAYLSIGVLFLYRIVSAIVIFVTEDNWRFGIAQFLDVLLYFEIFQSHTRLVSNIISKTVFTSSGRNVIASTAAEMGMFCFVAIKLSI